MNPQARIATSLALVLLVVLALLVALSLTLSRADEERDALRETVRTLAVIVCQHQEHPEQNIATVLREDGRIEPDFLCLRFARVIDDLELSDEQIRLRH